MDRGRTRPVGVMQMLKCVLPYICNIFPPLLACGTKFFFVFAGNVAACGASDEIVLIEAR